MSADPAGTAQDARLNLGDAFRTATGQNLSEAGEAGLRRFADVAGVSSNDAIWLILFGFEQYRNLYADIPRQVAEAAALTMREQAAALEAHGERGQEAMKTALAEKASEMHKALISQLITELKSGTARKVIEEQAREAMQGPVLDAAGKLERLSNTASMAMNRYERAHRGINQWLTIGLSGVVGGLMGGLMTALLLR
ncbi:MobE (plasmid) [Xanthomonas axonopodis pv. nakataecorchori]|uniref:MobE n=1 Tax=Xanthomonas axonopodis TaxID=53413 RepID=UPI0031C4F82B|nr:MobE [Xanthomonas perforans]MBZ3048168.1 MobE [Xanthomonas perforans]